MSVGALTKALRARLIDVQVRDVVIGGVAANLARSLRWRLSVTNNGASAAALTRLTIPAGTQSGRTFRLTGQGMPRFRGSGHGDLYVRVRVVLPATLSPEAREEARRFLDLVDQPNPRTSN